jgi:small subunit ribosomal protein S1
VKVLDIDRERQRISLGLKQTQSDPWQQVIDTYQQGDVVEGRVTKVVTFGAFVEVIPGVEGLVHISELAPHHVENPREVVQQGETLRAKIIEMDAERRRLSLSLKRVEEGESARPGIGEDAPELGLSDEVFTEQRLTEPEAPEAEPLEGGAAPEVEAVPEVEPEPEPEPETELESVEEAGDAVTDAVPEDEAAPEGEASAEPDDREQ